MKRKLCIAFLLALQAICFAQWNTDKIMTIGQNALYFEDFVLSIQYFNKVISVKPYLAEPYMFRAMAKAQLGDYKGAEEDAGETIVRNPFIPQAYYVRGFVRRKQQKFKEALEDFSKALEFSPNSAFILINRMDVLANMDEYQAALEDLNAYLKLNPQKTELLYERGQLQLMLKDTLAAEQTFNDFVKKEDANSRAWSARALFYLQENDLGKALADLNKAIDLGSTFVGDYINRGIIHFRQNRFMEALKDYDTAVKMDKTNSLAYYNRALLRASLGDTNNALDDLMRVLELSPSYLEARLRKGMLEAELGNYVESIRDYKIILDKHPDFIPAYVALAENEKKRGNKTASDRYYQQARDIEAELKNKKQKKEEIALENKIAGQEIKENTARRTEMFNRFTAQNMERAEKESKYVNQIRGNVQNRYTDVVSERNFILSLYAKRDDLRQKNNFHPLIEIYNERSKGTAIKITNNELALTEDLVKFHFEKIDNISKELTEDVKDADLFFHRAMQFALVQDISGAINDLNKAILLRPDFVLAYFFRANLRYKQIEYDNSVEAGGETKETGERLARKQYNFDSEMIMRDYDKVIALVPDFQFVYFNKANVLASLQDFRSAISFYSKAIELDPGFAEAYYNRGLVYLFLGEENRGLSDLSKAGELGLYKVYNLIQRFSR